MTIVQGSLPVIATVPALHPLPAYEISSRWIKEGLKPAGGGWGMKSSGTGTGEVVANTTQRLRTIAGTDNFMMKASEGRYWPKSFRKRSKETSKCLETGRRYGRGIIVDCASWG